MQHVGTNFDIFRLDSCHSHVAESHIGKLWRIGLFSILTGIGCCCLSGTKRLYKQFPIHQYFCMAEGKHLSCLGIFHMNRNHTCEVLSKVVNVLSARCLGTTHWLHGFQSSHRLSILSNQFRIVPRCCNGCSTPNHLIPIASGIIGFPVVPLCHLDRSLFCYLPAGVGSVHITTSVVIENMYFS